MPSHRRKVGLLPGVERAYLVGFGAIEQVAQRRVRQQLVADEGKRRGLLRPLGGAAGRHHRLVVPVEDSARPA